MINQEERKSQPLLTEGIKIYRYKSKTMTAHAWLDYPDFTLFLQEQEQKAAIR